MKDPREKDAFIICLAWHSFGHDNLGIDALAQANAALIMKAANRLGLNVRFITIGSHVRREGIELPAETLIGPVPSLRSVAKGDLSIFRAIRSSRLVIDIGEGDSFTDIYGRRRFLLQCMTKLGAILVGRRLILAPQTIGPFKHPLHAWLATFVMNRAKIVATRDELSSAFLQELKVAATRREYIDVAFALPFTPAPRHGDRKRVGFNVSGLLFNGGYTGQNELGLTLDYADLNRRLIKSFSELSGIEVVLFSHVSGGGGADDDQPVVERLAAEFPRITAMSPFISSVEAKSFISGLDFVVAGRMHASIGAYSAGVPVVPIAYSRKFNGLFGTLNYPFYVDGKALTTGDALKKIHLWFHDREKLAQAINASRAAIAERLQRYEDDLVDLLGEVLRDK